MHKTINTPISHEHKLETEKLQHPVTTSCPVQLRLLHCPAAAAALFSCGCCAVQLRLLHCLVAAAALFSCGCCTVRLWPLHCPAAAAALFSCGCCTVWLRLPVNQSLLPGLQNASLHFERSAEVLLSFLPFIG